MSFRNKWVQDLWHRALFRTLERSHEQQFKPNSKVSKEEV